MGGIAYENCSRRTSEKPPLHRNGGGGALEGVWRRLRALSGSGAYVRRFRRRQRPVAGRFALLWRTQKDTDPQPLLCLIELWVIYAFNPTAWLCPQECK